MIHANLVESGAFFGVAALTLLLMMFLYAVVTADPEEATRTETPLMPSPVLPSAPLPVRGTPAPLPVREAPAPLPVRRAPAFAPPAETGQPDGTEYAPTHRAAASVAPPLEVSSGPQRKPAAAFLFLIAGLVLTVIGGGMFFGTGQAVTVCANQALAICSDGFVVLHATQLLGGALAVGGIGLASTAIVLALR